MDEQEAATLFKALSDANRLRIVRLIANTENMCACNILEAFDITQPTLSHHMKVLCSCGLVDGRKEGKWMHYSLNRKVFSELKAYIELL
ncbi:MAG: metalloregulator ArsR/SmtB family transcription factor [Gordonibacter sp.]|nr:metalloregulator ArsR/SmtB family transcription factor [Gordonibacter sp.]